MARIGDGPATPLTASQREAGIAIVEGSQVAATSAATALREAGTELRARVQARAGEDGLELARRAAELGRQLSPQRMSDTQLRAAVQSAGAFRDAFDRVQARLNAMDRTDREMIDVSQWGDAGRQLRALPWTEWPFDVQGRRSTRSSGGMGGMGWVVLLILGAMLLGRRR